MEAPKQEFIKLIRDFFHSRLRQLTGVEDTSGVDLMQSIRVLSNLYDTVGSRNLPDQELSDPRWNLLLRLWIEEEMGVPPRMTPTQLSHFAQVNKNTISSLLKGLEKQGLIERRLDPLDKRLFIIHLTETGRDLVKKVTPMRLNFYNSLLSDLTMDERSQLSELLQKLIRTIIINSDGMK